VRINAPAGVVAFSASPITVSAGTSDSVVIRGVTLKALTPGSGTGIVFVSGDRLFVEDCVIDGWSTGIDVEAPQSFFVMGTTVRNITGFGLFVGSAARGAVEKSRFEAVDTCGVEAFGGAVAVRDSVFAGHTQDGATGVCARDTGEVNVDSSLIANYRQTGQGAAGSGIQAFSGGTVRVSHSIISGNDLGLFNNGSTLVSLGNNMVRGNTIDTFGTITTVSLQ
jgi:hypothetical protein